ncbi:tripartite motif-containing protein 16-like isoform X1 [Xiphophorus couchianus]|uniref:tripartite motif-containing protein 16-like isoform X1 n=1 Tax=Xiphophorus couchianus TaxID=32473 RepID=UPI001016B22C|nr:tripartite motif-containing protein 16-like isoform X1 [Xiphophorus couchianus]
MTTTSTDVEENLREKVEDRPPATPLRQDVMCDSCMDAPSRALKSCLTCLVSYCEAHLRPHLEKDKFQNHRLVDPLHDIERQTCEVHQLPFKSFCFLDECSICGDCEGQEHEGHEILSLEEARVHFETELLQKHQRISQHVSDVERIIGKLQSNGDLIKSSAQEVCVTVEQQFNRLQKTVEEARKRVEALLEGEQKQALRQGESIQAHLEQKRVKLMKTADKMKKLSKSKSDVDFLKDYTEGKKGLIDICMSTVHISRMHHLHSWAQAVTDVTQELCDLIMESYSEKMNMVSKSAGAKHAMPESLPSTLPDPETQEDFLTYTTRLTFDPDTTHYFLRLTVDNRKLTNTSPWRHSYQDHPSRFEYWRQAMTSESLYLGRHYIEAELSGVGTHVGVAYRSIDPKGEESGSCITGNDFSWCVGRNNRGFSVWHAGEETPLEASDIARVGIYVDFHRGLVSFYNTTGPMMLLHTYNTDFIEPLYITAWLSKKDNVVTLVNAK